MRVNCVIHAVVQPVLNVYSDHCHHHELSLNIHHNNGIILVVSTWLGYEIQLCYPVVQPEEYVWSHHCQYEQCLKGQCHEIFDFCFFFMIQFPPSP
jgi:hypothetical protein